jgi:hypothetical protein
MASRKKGGCVRSPINWLIGLIALGAVAMIALGNESVGKAGYFVLGAVLTMATTLVNEYLKRKRQVRDLARVLYAELTHLVARCVFESEKPWKSYWPKDAGDLMTATELRKFVPTIPTIYNATAGQLALLLGSSADLD